MNVTKYVRKLSPKTAKKIGKEELIIAVKAQIHDKPSVRYVASEAAVIKGRLTEPEIILDFLEKAGIAHSLTTVTLDEE